ncbi:DUF4011 domain-containing protein [Thermomonas brevis]
MDAGLDDAFDGSLSIPEVLRRLQHRLLDLTARNRLLNFKITAGKALPMVPGRLDATYRRLTRQTSTYIQIVPVPDPSRDEWVVKHDRMVKPEAKEHAVRLGLNIQLEEVPEDWDAAGIARVQYYNEDLAKHFRKIDREARLALEETGANMLFLVLGCLDFTENPSSDKVLSAPLVCVPVELGSVEIANTTVFNLKYTGEEIQENLSLREKLKRDHTFTLPDFPGEEDGVETYYREIEQLIKNRPRWKVRRSMTLALLSFGNMLLIRDLDPDNWSNAKGESTLLSHPVINRIFRGGDDASDLGYAIEYDLDRHPNADIPLIYDADSSQHSAIVDVMEGKSIVIEGPPGTGKSQTITNIIAACLHAGKSVLFIAEKLTALQVVQRRLQAAGLDHFLLELHSNKTNKRQVLESLNSRIDLRTSTPIGLDSLIAGLTERKQKLDEHAKLLNTITGNQLGLTVHQILWRAERHRVKLGEHIETLAGMVVPSAPQAGAGALEANLNRVTALSQTYMDIARYDQSSPFWGFYPDSLAPGDDLKVERILRSALDFAVQARELSLELVDTYGLRVHGDAGEADTDKIASVLEELDGLLLNDAAIDILPAIFGRSRTNQENALQVLKRHNGILQSVFELEGVTAGKVDYDKAEQANYSDGSLRFVQHNGMAGLHVGELNNAIQQLDGLLKAAVPARQALNAILEWAGLSQDSTEGDDKLRAIMEVCAVAPLDHLDMRSAELSKPHAVEVLNKGNMDRVRLQSTEENLASRLYLDQAPSDGDLREWILVLREGDAWYRIFQKPWRTAIKAHRSLLRAKTKMPASQRLADLEELSELRKGWAAWTNAPLLTRVAGVSTMPVDFALLDAAKVAKWLKEANASLELANVAGTTFDPVSIERTAILGHLSKMPDATAALDALHALDAWITQSCPQLTEWTGSHHWNLRLTAAGNLLGHLRQVANDFAGAIHSDATLEQGYVLVRQAQELFAKSHAISDSAELREVLGDRATRFREDLPAIMAAVRFGQAVLDTPLPIPAKQLLWTTSAQSALDDMRQNIAAFDDRYAQLNEALLQLEQYGELDIESWMCGSDESTSTENACRRLQAALEQIDELIPWSLYIHHRADCIAAGLDAFVLAMEGGKLPPSLLVDAFSYRFYSSIAESLFRRTPALQNFSGSVHTNTRQEFSNLDRDLVSLRGKQISHQSKRMARTEPGSNGTRVADKTEMNLIQHLLPQSRPRIALRDLLTRSGKSIRQLKPCFMMGPQAVAQYLMASPEMFDVVIMDEASQMRPEHAVGAIARGRQLVVVGDPKQLPPTSFFSRISADGDSQEVSVAEEAESILDLASSHFRPMRSLRWHYRSRHESLIAFSNKQFYDGKLIVFPSPFPRSRGLGVRTHYVKNAVYESQTNLREAAAVVDAVVEHILHTPDLSLGIVALNIRQRDLIAELVEERLRSTRGAEDYRNKWKDEGQDIFVKNLENVQGDERDTIIISTTYGPPPDSTRVHQYFGPISQDGGWRRLNVLFTRARASVLLVTSMKHTDIVVGPGTPRGTAALRDYLLYAESGRLNHDPGEATGGQPESEFEVAVIKVLRDLGYDCVPQVGVANFRIDIGVRHPQYPHLFLAAIECDGATYHSGITVRDRDRIRQEILESMGWRGKIWRIWSTEWFRNPRRELSRLTSFLEELKQQAIEPSQTVPIEVQAPNTQEDLPEPTQAELKLASTTLEQLVTEDSRTEVRVGDRVVYRNLSDLLHAREINVLISKDRFDPNNGIVSEASPLGQALIGAVEGEEVPFSTPAKPDQVLVVVRIERMGG